MEGFKDILYIHVAVFPLILLAFLIAFITVLYLIYRIVRDMEVSVYSFENVYSNISRDKFLEVFKNELERRGIKYDYYKDFFMKIKMFAKQEKENLRVGVKIEVSPEYLILTIILLIIFPIVGAIFIILWILKFYSVKENINNAISSTLSQV